MGSNDGSDDVIRTPLISKKVRTRIGHPNTFPPFLEALDVHSNPMARSLNKFGAPRQHPNRSDALLDAYFAPNTLFCSLKHELWKENYYNFDE